MRRPSPGRACGCRDGRPTLASRRPRPVDCGRRRSTLRPAQPPSSPAPAPAFGLVLAAFAGIAFVVYLPALDGGFVSDDQHYVWGNVYVRDASLAHVMEILDPRGDVVPLVENYAPVHLLLHSLEWAVFGENTRGYHLVNLLLHALASSLLFLFFARLQIPRPWAALGALLFLVHPANVEAVAWVSQLKSVLALALGLGAILAHPSRPLFAVGLFALSLLAKPAGLVALPVVVMLGWVRGDAPTGPGGGASSWRWPWLVGWGVVLGIFAVLELQAFGETAGTHPVVYADTADRLRSSVANAGRYLWMATTTLGLSAFHDPAPIRSWLSPAFGASLLALTAVAWRIVVVLRGRRVEAVCWAWAAAGFAPVCGILSLPFPLADRYLYFVLPGLIGVLLLALRDVGAWLVARRSAAGRDAMRFQRLLVAAGALLAASLVLGFSVRSFERARLWGREHRLVFDSAQNYPLGRAALLQRARAGAVAGDSEAMLVALEDLHDRGFSRIDQLLQDPVYEPHRSHPRFQRLLARMASDWLERLRADPDPSQSALYLMAVAHQVRGEETPMLRALERALEAGGPQDEQIRRELDEIRRRQRLLERRSGSR
ncbi:MAG: hypothetical protein ABFS46_06935 [Myxococcota bacterium]